MEVNTRYGKVLMRIGNRYKKEHANLEFEKEFIKILEEEEYDFFIDVGAGWGYHTVIAADHCDKVYAFEPSAERNELLVKNIISLDLYNVMSSIRAVGTAKLNLFSGQSMYGPKTGIRNTSVEVRWVPLEVIAKPHLSRGQRGIIKIDVEGNELDVIESAGNLYLYKNCIWLIERHEKRDIADEITLGYIEEDLVDAMMPFEGEKVNTRKWTSHYVFRWREG